MHIVLASIGALVLIALGAFQMGAKNDSKFRDFTIVAIIALIITFFYS